MAERFPDAGSTAATTAPAPSASRSTAAGSSSPLDSSSFMSWGQRGKGRWITVYTNPGHAYVVIAGLRLDTSGGDRRLRRGAPRRQRPALAQVQPLARGLHGAPPAATSARSGHSGGCSPRRRYPPDPRTAARSTDPGAPIPMAVASPHDRQDRRAEGDHRHGAPVRRRADPPERRALRPRGRVPGADRRADEGARALRRHDPRGVRRDGARPDHLRDDRRGALARLDLDLRDHQHPLHRLLPADEVRLRRAEAEVPAADGHRRDPRRLLALRARAGLRRPGDQDGRQEDRRRRLRDQRPEDVGHQRPALGARVRAGQDRPRRRAAPQGHDLLHRREGAGRAREHGRLRRLHRPAAAQEDGLQGRRVHRAGLRRLPLPGREHPRRRGGGPQQGLLRR